MNKPSRVRDVLFRLLAAVFVGTLVAGIAYLCAYYNYRGYRSYRYDAWRTQSELRRLHELVEDYRQSTGHLPATLAEVEQVKYGFHLDENGNVLDGWDRPIQYRVEENDFTLISYGRDGQPGGEWDDADLEPNRPLDPPTLWQFTFQLPTGGMRAAGVLAGVCAGLACLLPPRKRNRVSLIVQVGVTSVGAVIVAVIVSVIHIPTGH